MNKLEILELLFELAGKGAIRFAELYSDLWIETSICCLRESFTVGYDVWNAKTGEKLIFSVGKGWNRTELENRLALKETLEQEIDEMIASLSGSAFSYYSDGAEHE